jgi:hypothetical protein
MEAAFAFLHVRTHALESARALARVALEGLEIDDHS